MNNLIYNIKIKIKNNILYEFTHNIFITNRW